MEAEHSVPTVEFDSHADEYSVPRWQVRRLTVAMSHSDSMETKIIEG